MINWVIFMKKAKELLITFIFIFIAIMCIIASDNIGASVYSALQRCLTTVIPSLFAMIAASTLLIRSGAITRAGKTVHKAGRILFGMDGDIFLIFLFSNIAGYPVGLRMLMSSFETGRLTKRESELLAGVCIGSGPAFIYGCIAQQLYQSANIGLLILLSTSAGSIITASILSVYLRKNSHGSPEHIKMSMRADILSECISSAGLSMAEICASILGFAALSAILIRIGLIPAAADILSWITKKDFSVSAGLICSFLDVTAINSLPFGDYTLLPIITALVSFGGGCIFTQLAAISRGRISLLPAIVIRMAAAAISYGICRLMLPLFIAGKTVSAAVTTHIYSAPSPVPSLILMAMTAMVFIKCEKGRKA